MIIKKKKCCIEIQSSPQGGSRAGAWGNSHEETLQMPELSALLDFLFLASREKIEQRSQGHWYRRICRDLKHRTALLLFF